MLLVLGVTGLPVAVLLNQLAGRIFSMDYTARVLHEQVFSTPKLAVRLKAVVNEQMKEVSDLKTGMIVAIFLQSQPAGMAGSTEWAFTRNPPRPCIG